MQLEEAQQLAAAAVGVEQPGRAATHAAARGGAGRPAFLVGQQQLGGVQPRELGLQRVVADDLVGEEAPRRQVGPGQSVAVAAAAERKQQRVAALGQQGLVGHRAGRDDPHHLAFDQALAGGGVAHLLADGDRLAQRDQAREIALGSVVRHAGHRDRLPARAAALGQGDVEQARGLARVVVEQLVEVAHAEEQQHVGVLRLGGEELLHQRGVFGRLVQRHASGVRGARRSRAGHRIVAGQGRGFSAAGRGRRAGPAGRHRPRRRGHVRPAWRRTSRRRRAPGRARSPGARPGSRRRCCR